MIKPLIFRTLNPNSNPLRTLTMSAVLGMTVALSGCSMLSVYKIDLPQGTPITQTDAQKLKVGMNQNQVLYILIYKVHIYTYIFVEKVSYRSCFG